MNSIFYSPNMLKLGVNPAMKPAFRGNNMGKDIYSEYLDEIKTCINEDTVPEIGVFPPLKSEKILEDNNCIVFQVKSSAKNEYQKILNISFMNAKNRQLTSKTRIFENRAALLENINSIDSASLENLVKSLKLDTED